ncbi:hypothetical protein [Oceanobacter kriegii]|uniref:hypothetical protein n=1 Tax=Oceanobacter kriegii TaxID=64972 RepID=UPI0003F6953B|nr:hypothetical protein [Oceanobacter kriegii]
MNIKLPRLLSRQLLLLLPLLALLLSRLLAPSLAVRADQATAEVTSAPASTVTSSTSKSPYQIDWPQWGEVNGYPIRLDEARFWLKFSQRQPSLTERTPTDIEQQAISYMCQQRQLRTLASQHDIVITDNDEQKWQLQRQQGIRRYGGLGEYLIQVRRMYQSEAMYHWLHNSDLLADRLFEQMYGVNGEKAPPNTIDQYMKEHQLVYGFWLYELGSDSDKLSDLRKQLDGKTAQQQLALMKGFRERQVQQGKRSEGELVLASSSGNRQKPDARQPDSRRPTSARLISLNTFAPEVAEVIQRQPLNQAGPLINAADGHYLMIRLPVSAGQAVNNSNRPLSYWAARQQLFRPLVEEGCRV